MNNSRTDQLKNYMLALPLRLQRTALTFALFFGLYVPIGLADGNLREIAGPASIIALILSSITFFSGWFKLHKAVDDALTRITATGVLTEVLDDFDASTRIPKLGRIGQHYFFGEGTGTLVDLREVRRIRYVREAYNDDGRTRYSSHLKFEVHGGLEEFVSLHNPACKRRAREALTLLDGHCPIDEEVRAKYLS